MSDIFISYASADHDYARKLASALEALGWSVWWDRKIITGQAFDQVIERELYSAKSVIVLWSSASVASEWVKNEAAAASERGVLLPALIERVALPLEFRRKQTADLVGWDGDPSHSGFQALGVGISSTRGAAAPNRSMIPPRRRSWFNSPRTLAPIAAAIVALILGVYFKAPWRAQAPQPAQQEDATEAGASWTVSEAPSESPPARTSTSSNLLSAENGGQLLLAPDDAWAVVVDGKEDDYRAVKVGDEAVFGFKDERAATFDTFGMLIPASGRNPKEFELLAADESPTGPFRTIGTFHPQNVKVFKTAGWQDFKFTPVTAKYLKIKLRSNHEEVVWIHLYEFRLLGAVEPGQSIGSEASAPNGKTAELADLVAGKYFGDVIADSKGSSRSDVVLTLTKLDEWTVRVTSDYPRLGAGDVTLTRLDNKIVNAGGDTVFLLDTERQPFVLEYNPHGEVAYAGRKQ